MKYSPPSVLIFLILSIVHSSNAFSSPSRKGYLVSSTTKISNFPPKGLKCSNRNDNDPTKSLRPTLLNFWCNNNNNGNSKDAQHWACWMTSILVFVSTFGYPNVVTAMENGPPTTAATTTTQTSGSKSRYYSIMEEGSLEDRRKANGALFDWMVGTINTQYYDQTGGAVFSVKEFYSRWKHELPSSTLDTREDTVNGLKWLVQSMNDPYSKYLTQQELKEELTTSSSSELESTIGILVEQKNPSSKTLTTSKKAYNDLISKKKGGPNDHNNIISTEYIQQHSLPMVTAVIPDSLAERNGIVAGDYIIAIGNDSSLSSPKTKIRNDKILSTKDSDVISMTMAKPIILSEPSSAARKDAILGYRLSHVQLHNHHPTDNNNNLDTTTVSIPYNSQSTIHTDSVVSGGNSIVHYQLLTPQQSLLFSSDFPQDKVGYIRLTRFSRSATEGYIQAVKALEQAGAQSYIIDIRNNYGGIIQEAFITASTLLHDPHMVLSYTLNSRGGFSPQEVQKYTSDPKFPGHVLSKKVFVNTNQDWLPPSSYASIHEQSIKYGIHRPTSSSVREDFVFNNNNGNKNKREEKKIVILMNEGTASSAEVFASSLHDNGRLVALIGAKTYGKGLIQHTFPMPDGGGLRLTVGEYLTPSLQHVTKVGSAKYNDIGELIGGGIQPDILCPSTHGIPSNIGADICVGMALDALEVEQQQNPTPFL